jgi:hypothetical protein
MARNSANGFAHLLGLHLQALGVKYRVLSFLHGLGLINSYKTPNTKASGELTVLGKVLSILPTLLALTAFKKRIKSLYKPRTRVKIQTNASFSAGLSVLI